MITLTIVSIPPASLVAYWARFRARKQRLALQGCNHASDTRTGLIEPTSASAGAHRSRARCQLRGREESTIDPKCLEKSPPLARAGNLHWRTPLLQFRLNHDNEMSSELRLTLIRACPGKSERVSQRQRCVVGVKVARRSRSDERVFSVLVIIPGGFESHILADHEIKCRQRRLIRRGERTEWQ